MSESTSGDRSPSGRHRVAASTLAHVAALKDMPRHVLETIAESVESHRYEKGDTIFHHLDTSRDLYIILAGQVRVSLVASTGRAITYQILPSGSMFGEVAAIDGRPRSTSIHAEEDVVLARLAPSAFNKLLDESSEFARAIILRLVDLSRGLTERLFEYHAYDVRGRVYSVLLRLTAADPEAAIRITDRDMASRVGTTRENISRIHAELRKGNIIERDHSQLRVKDRGKLEEALKDSEFG